MIAGDKVGAVVAAGGTGKRMGTDRPKQYLDLLGTPVILRTIEVLQASPVIDLIVVAAPEELVGETEGMIRTAALAKVLHVVAGGAERQDTVWNGLQALRSHAPELVVVQDAVRPFIDGAMIARVVEAARACGAAVPAISSTDTVKLADAEGMVLETPDRVRLWNVQTPQAFRFPLLWQAFESARARQFRGTDDASLVEQIGGRVKIVEGSAENIKITTPADLELAAVIVRRRTREL